MTISEKVARALRDATQIGTPEPGQLYTYLATTAINAFLEAAAEQGWRMAKDEATAEMVEAIMKGTETFEAGMLEFCRHYKGEDYRAMLAAAPEFEWDK